MSRGTRVVPVRLPPGLVRHAELVIDHRNQNTRNEPWTFSEFVRVALQEKIRKMERSRKRPLADKDGRPFVYVDFGDGIVARCTEDQAREMDEILADEALQVAKPGANS